MIDAFMDVEVFSNIEGESFLVGRFLASSEIEKAVQNKDIALSDFAVCVWYGVYPIDKIPDVLP